MIPDRNNFLKPSPANALHGAPASSQNHVSETSVHFSIGRLTVEGMSHQDRARMVQSMECEITRLAQTNPVSEWQTGHRKSSEASRYPPEATAEEIGRHVASAIFRALNQ